MTSIMQEIVGLEIIAGNMTDLLTIFAMLIWLVGIAFAAFTNHSWKNVGILWAITAVGAMLFGIALTL